MQKLKGRAQRSSSTPARNRSEQTIGELRERRQLFANGATERHRSVSMLIMLIEYNLRDLIPTSAARSEPRTTARGHAYTQPWKEGTRLTASHESKFTVVRNDY